MRTLPLLAFSALSAAAAEPAVPDVGWREGLASPQTVGDHVLHWYRTNDMALGLKIDVPKDGGATAVSLSEYGTVLFSVPDIRAAPATAADGRIRIFAVEPDPPLVSMTMHDRYVAIADTRRDVLFVLSFDTRSGHFSDDVSPQAVVEMKLYLAGLQRQMQADPHQPLPPAGGPPRSAQPAP